MTSHSKLVKTLSNVDLSLNTLPVLPDMYGWRLYLQSDDTLVLAIMYRGHRLGDLFEIVRTNSRRDILTGASAIVSRLLKFGDVLT